MNKTCTVLEANVVKHYRAVIGKEDTSEVLLQFRLESLSICPVWLVRLVSS